MSDATTSLEQSPLSEEAVRWAYRMILGREPESQAIIAEQIQTHPDAHRMRASFLQSVEFSRSLPAQMRIQFSGHEPPIRVDCDGPPDALQRLFEHVNRNWHELGESEPFWSVLTAPEYRGIPQAESIRRFFASGPVDVRQFLDTLARSDLDLTGRTICLEYGCGLGRITRALAPHFHKTIGVDISKSHLDHARRYAKRDGILGIEWQHLASVDSLDQLPQVDVIYSMIVLQHNPPPVIDRIIAAFARILKPGGLAYFQVPTYRIGYCFDLQRYLKTAASVSGMEMHVYPQHRIFRHFADAGAIPLSVEEDDKTGIPGERSNTFLFHRGG